MAQLGARLNGIEEVEGSNPSGSTKSEDGSSMQSARESGLYSEIQAFVSRGAHYAELAYQALYATLIE